MLSKGDTRKKIDEISGSGKFLNDLETISKALFVDKTPPRLPSSADSCPSEPVRESPLSQPKNKPEKAKDNNKASVRKEKKASFWCWRGLKAWTHGRNRRFNCCFSLLVHSIDGLPSLFDDFCLVVHWKRRDGDRMTSSAMVHKGVAGFEEQLTHSCSLHVSISSTRSLVKYEAKEFLLYASVHDAPEIDLGKNHIDLTKLLPPTLKELEGEKSSGKCTTSFRLSGKATGAILKVSFGYIAVGDLRETSSKNSLSWRQNRVKTETFVNPSDIANEPSILRLGSLPARLAALQQSAEDVKDLHEVVPMPTSELHRSENVLYQKLDEEVSNGGVDNKSNTGPFSSHLDSSKVNSFKHPDSEDPSKVAPASGKILEADGVVEVILNKDDTLHPPSIDNASKKQNQSKGTCISTEKESSMLSKELVMQELEMALSRASDLMNEGLDSHEDESEVPLQDSSLNINSHFGDLGNQMLPNLDDSTDAVANEFLEMLGVEHSQIGLSSGSEPDSPRERLLKQFEKDCLASGGMLNFDIGNDPSEVVSDIPRASAWEAMSNAFYQSSILEGFRETSQMERDVPSQSASMLEDLETEALMRDLDLNEKSFQHSPLSKSDGFCSSDGTPPEDLHQLAAIAEGLGPFLQKK